MHESRCLEQDLSVFSPVPYPSRFRGSPIKGLRYAFRLASSCLHNACSQVNQVSSSKVSHNRTDLPNDIPSVGSRNHNRQFTSGILPKRKKKEGENVPLNKFPSSFACDLTWTLNRYEPSYSSSSFAATKSPPSVCPAGRTYHPLLQICR